MKRTIYLSAIFTALLLCKACDSDNETIFHTPASVNISNNEILLDENNYYELSYNTTRDWSISVADTDEDNWYDISPREGKAGNGKITIKAKANETLHDRVLLFSLKSDSAEQPVRVSQPMGCGVTDINIPDQLFRKYCIDNFDMNGDGSLSAKEASIVKTIAIDYSNITSFAGIEYFTSLTSFTLESTKKISELNLTRNKHLTKIIIKYCNLEAIDLSGNAKLEYLDLYYNSLTDLDLNNKSCLEYLRCSENKLTTLNLQGAPALSKLYCRWNELTSINLTNNPELIDLNLEYNSLSFLDLTSCIKIQSILSYSYSGRELSEIWLNKILENKNIQIDKHSNTKVIYK